MLKSIDRFIGDEGGQDVVEYALLVALIALATLAAWNAIVAAVTASYGRTDSGLWDLYWTEPS